LRRTATGLPSVVEARHEAPRQRGDDRTDHLAQVQVELPLPHRDAAAGEEVGQLALRLGLEPFERAPLRTLSGVGGPARRRRIGRLSVHFDPVALDELPHVVLVHLIRS